MLVRNDPDQWKRLFREWRFNSYEFPPRTPYRNINRNKLTGDMEEIESIPNSYGLEIRSGQCYLIDGHSEGEALFRVSRIFRQRMTGSCYATGNLFLNSNDLDDIVPIQGNEVVWIVDYVSGSKVSLKHQALETISVESLEAPCNISFKSFHGAYSPSGLVLETGGDFLAEATSSPLLRICRLVYFRGFPSQREYSTRSYLPAKGTIRSLNAIELEALDPFFEEERTLPKPKPPPNGQYRFGDICHGAGGATEAAKLAGLKPVMGLDIDPIRHDTYKINNPDIGEGALLMDVSDFERWWNREDNSVRFWVDVLHFSMPCRLWSAAKTWDAPGDYDNGKVLFEMINVIRLVKPRIVTMEQVPGIVSRCRNRHVFYVLIGELVGLGYSVSWDVFPLNGWGNPSVRKRLLLFAAQPGERLPPFPKPTYGPGLQEYVTVNEAIHNIPPGLPHHDIEDVFLPFPKPAWNGDFPLRHTPTGSTSQSYHPSGQRKFTIREHLRLQGFPDSFEMTGKYGECRRQIADAVPPKAFVPFLQEVVKTLTETDQGLANVSSSVFEEPLVEA